MGGTKFTRTGQASIDAVADALECASTCFRSTDLWYEGYPDSDDPSHVERIDAALERAAADHAAALAERDATIAELGAKVVAAHDSEILALRNNEGLRATIAAQRALLERAAQTLVGCRATLEVACEATANLNMDKLLRDEHSSATATLAAIRENLKCRSQS